MDEMVASTIVKSSQLFSLSFSVSPCVRLMLHISSKRYPLFQLDSYPLKHPLIIFDPV